MQRRICFALSVILLVIAVSMLLLATGLFDKLVAFAIFLWALLTAYCVWGDRED